MAHETEWITLDAFSRRLKDYATPQRVRRFVLYHESRGRLEGMTKREETHPNGAWMVWVQPGPLEQWVRTHLVRVGKSYRYVEPSASRPIAPPQGMA
jgi:hypothetical protein